MSRRLLALALSACCIASITPLARSQGQVVRTQAIALELTIVELAGAQPDEIEKIEKGGEYLKRLMNESKAKMIAHLHLRTRLGEAFSTRVGQRDPIRSAIYPSFQSIEQVRRNTKEPVSPQAGTFGFPELAYESTGLNVDGSAVPAGEDRYDIRIKIEMSALDRRTGKLTPTILHRTFTDVVRMKEGETALVMGLIQQEPPWSLPTQNIAGDASFSRSSFIVLLTARQIQ